MQPRLVLLVAFFSSTISSICCLPATQKSIRCFARNKPQNPFAVYATSPDNNKNDNKMLNKLAAAAVVLGAAFFWNNIFPATNRQELYETVEGRFLPVLFLDFFHLLLPFQNCGRLVLFFCLFFLDQFLDVHFLFPSDIPSSYFKEHKTLYGVVVKVNDGDTYKIRHVPGGPNAKVHNGY